MQPTQLIYVLKLIFCRPKLAAWLRAAASDTKTPIDDWMVDLIYNILGPPTE